MVETKESPKRNFHEGGKIDRKKVSRGKPGARGGPTRSERENPGVEDGNSTSDSADSTVLPVQETPPPEVERPGVLTPDQIKAVQNDYRLGFTVKQIRMVTGIKPATIYKHIQGIEQQQPIPAAEENIKADPPQSSLSQPPQSPSPSAQPPRIEPIDSALTDTERPTNSEPNGDYLGYGSYEAYRDSQSRRIPLPPTDSQTIQELLLLFGRDMRRRGYTSFVDYFENYVIPMFERAEFWMENIPGTSPAEKDHTFRRYLWIVERFLRAQKEYGEYEAMNNGVKPQES
jgi:hypothetical protein